VNSSFYKGCLFQFHWQAAGRFKFEEILRAHLVVFCSLNIFKCSPYGFLQLHVCQAKILARAVTNGVHAEQGVQSAGQLSDSDDNAAVWAHTHLGEVPFPPCIN
jgi:hypothetical protein